MPDWLSRQFRMTAEAEFRWQRTFRRPVQMLVAAGTVLVVFGLLPGSENRGVLIGTGVATWIGCVLIRFLAADGGRG